MKRLLMLGDNSPIILCGLAPQSLAAQGYQIWAKALAALLVKVLPETLAETSPETNTP